MAEIGRAVDDALAARPASESPWVALRRALDVVADGGRAGDRDGLPFMRLMVDVCRLRTHEWERTQGWQSMLAPTLFRRSGATDPGASVRASALAAAAVSCLDIATDHWIASDAERSLATPLDEAMGALAPVG
jgi:hypothetical protein